MDIDRYLSEFLEGSGLLAGRVPRMPTLPRYTRNVLYYEPFHAWLQSGIAMVETPVEAVSLQIYLQFQAPKPLYIGGVSVGMGRFSLLLPDMLLGFIDVSGYWHWAGGHHGLVVNLHTKGEVIFPPTDAWPVWFTFADCEEYRKEFMWNQIEHIDIYESTRRTLRAAFWERTRQEFIEKTWAPDRLPWCLDHEEYAELFSEPM